MFRKIIVMSAAMAGLAASAASASPLAAEDGAPAPRPAVGLQLAQSQDVEIYYDRFGRRVVVDAYTGEVLSIERPRREVRRQRPRQERYYLDDPDDMARLRRDRALRQRQPGRAPVEEYEIYPEEPDYEAFPEAPRRDFEVEEEAPVVRRAPARRNPLEGEPIRRAPLEAPDDGGDNGGSIVEIPDNDIEALPDEAPPQVAVQEPQPDAPVVDDTPPAAIAPDQPSITFGAREEVAGLQILLDRAGASPGVIDGKFGSNVDKAIVAYRDITGVNLKSTDTVLIKAELAKTGGDPFTTYQITQEDAAGPYVASVPEDYGQKAKLERLSYTSVAEMLAERFHMDQAYLKALNPEANFGRVGTIIKVANTGAPIATPVARIVADKGRKQVRAYGADGRLVVIYPATIGSSDTPSPTGQHKVARIAFDPEYTYNPNINFKQGDNHGVLTIPPGPNGPVGSIWIALSKPTYGIHGTPEPSKIGKTESHGCVRLTNWDAAELAKIVKPDVPVEFVE